MSFEGDHNDELPSSISGVADTGNLKGGAGFVATAKRQSMLNKPPQGFYGTASFLAIQAQMDAEYFQKQLRDAAKQNRRDNQVTSDNIPLTGALLLGAMNIPGMSVRGMDNVFVYSDPEHGAEANAELHADDKVA